MGRGISTRWCTALATACGLYAGTVLADAPAAFSLTETRREILELARPAYSRFAVADVDGDGIDDVVFVGIGGNDALAVVGKMADDSIGIKQALILDGQQDTRRVLAATFGDGTHIILVDIDGTVHDFAGWPLRELTWFATGLQVTSAAVGDLYGNGGMDLIIGANDGVHAYALDTHQALWDYASATPSDVLLAQLDGDRALEVVLDTGLIFDGATRATEWQYIDPFGVNLVAGHFLADTSTQFAGAASWSQFSVFRGSPYSPLWSAGNAPGIGALAAGNIDGGGRDVILLGDSQWGSVHVFDTTTHAERFAIDNPGYGVIAIALADINGNGVPYIVFSSGQSFQSVAMEIVDSQSGAVKWSLQSLSGSFSPVAMGDVDGDGADELVVGNNTGNSYGVAQIFNLQTGALKWSSPSTIGNANDPFYLSTSRVLLIPHAHDNAMDIAFAGTSIYDGRITVIDGATHAVKLQIGSYASGPMRSRTLQDAALLDFDNDGTPDFVAATAGSSGALLQVFSGVDGHTLWTSVSMGNGSSMIDGVLVTGPSSNPSSEMIAVLPGSLRAYNVQTELLDWSLLATSTGATYVPNGQAGAEIAVFQQSGSVTFFDAATHHYLRALVTPPVLNALQPLPNDPSHLIAVADGRIIVLGALDGTVLARSEPLGDATGAGNQLAVHTVGNNQWTVAVGNNLGAFVYTVAGEADEIFGGTFEP